ncbi:MAG TPA: VanZ family protein [Gemmatimonadaceae bacterium]
MVTAPRRSTTVALVALSFALIAFFTLRPSPAIVMTPTFCIFCGALGGVDFVLNVLLFVPLGLSLQWTTGRWHMSAIIGLTTTLVIEGLQWRIITGRDASLGDLLANTLGTLLGVWIATAVFRWLNATGVTARRYAEAWGIAAVVVIIVSGWLLQPVVPRNPQWVQWTPVRLNTEPFKGHLISVELKTRTIRGVERVEASEAFDTLARSLSVRANIRSPGGPTRLPAIIVRIANDKEEGFTLGQSGQSAVFRTYIAAAKLRLRPILVGLDRAFGSSERIEADADFTIEGTSTTQYIFLRRSGAEGVSDVRVPRTVGLAWALLLPQDVALDGRWWVANAVWLAALMIPVSFFTMRSAKSTEDEAGRGIAWRALLIVLATLGATAATPLSGLAAGEWLGVLAGIAAGWQLERWTAPFGHADLKNPTRMRSILS